jgi:hypothetical protein
MSEIAIGIAIEYFLGIYFLVESFTWSEKHLVADVIRLIAGIILLACAYYGKSLIG